MELEIHNSSFIGNYDISNSHLGNFLINLIFNQNICFKSISFQNNKVKGVMSGEFLQNLSFYDTNFIDFDYPSNFFLYYKY